MVAARTQLETASSEPAFAMQSGHSPMGYFALGIGALHSTTSSRVDFMVSSGTLVRPSYTPRTTASGQSGPHSGDTIRAAKELDSARWQRPIRSTSRASPKRRDTSFGTLQASSRASVERHCAGSSYSVAREDTVNQRKRLGAARGRLVPILCQTQSRRGEELRVTWEEFRAANTSPWMIGSTSSRAG